MSMWLQGRLKYVATTNSDQLALVNAYNGWMHSQFTKAYADSHCLHMASLLMIKGLFFSVHKFLMCCVRQSTCHLCTQCYYSHNEFHLLCTVWPETLMGI